MELSLRRVGDIIRISFVFTEQSKYIVDIIKTIYDAQWDSDDGVWTIPVEEFPIFDSLFNNSNYKFYYAGGKEDFFNRIEVFKSIKFPNQIRLYCLNKNRFAEFKAQYKLDEFGLFISPTIDSIKPILSNNDIFYKYPNQDKLIYNLAATYTYSKEYFLKPKSFKPEIDLFPHQYEGLNYAYKFKKFIFCDSVGVGKTAQILGVIARLLDHNSETKSLIIAPASVKIEWVNAIKKFTTIKFSEIEGDLDERIRLWYNSTPIKICSYEMMVKDIEAIYENNFDLVAADEVTKIKNYKSKATIAIKTIKSKYRIAASATVVENNLDELYSIFSWVNPNVFGYFWNYDNRYCIRNHYRKITSHKNLNELQAKIRGSIIRRTNENIDIKMPTVTSKYLCSKIDANTHIIYNYVTEELKKNIIDGRLTEISYYKLKHKKEKTENEKNEQKLLYKYFLEKNGNVISLFNLLIQICDDPKLILSSKSFIAPKLIEKFNDTISNCTNVKIFQLDRIIDKFKCKIIIFTRFSRMVKLLEEHFKNKNINTISITSKISQKLKRSRQETFKTHKHFNILLATDCISYGVNFKEARVVVNFDLPFNPAKLAQRNGRIMRIDSNFEKILTYNLVTNTEIENRIYKIIERRKDLFSVMLNEGKMEKDFKFNLKGLVKLFGIKLPRNVYKYKKNM